jgi:hypothetical protein
MEDIDFSDITEEFGESFKVFLKTVGERRAGYINYSLPFSMRKNYFPSNFGYFPLAVWRGGSPRE